MNEIKLGDNKDLIKELKDNSIDLVLTDPPYGLNMASWDKNLPHKNIWGECLRVLKPGGFLLVMSSPRQDLLWKLIRDIEVSGFKIDFPSFYWAYAQGAGKGLNLDLAYKKKLKKEGLPLSEEMKGKYSPNCFKPSVELILFAMKPISEKTYLDNAMVWNKGYINRDNGRLPTNNSSKSFREPTHLISEDKALDDGISRKSGVMDPSKHKRGLTNKDQYQGNTYGKFNLKDKPLNKTIGDSGSFDRFFSIEKWWEEKSKTLPEEVKKIFPFLAVKKPSTKEKEAGLEVKKRKNSRPKGVAYQKDSNIFSDVLKASNNHVSVKPIKLMSYLIELTTNEGDIVLDPFLGTGTTLISAKLLNRNFVGFEINENYYNIGQKRLEYWKNSKIKNSKS